MNAHRLLVIAGSLSLLRGQTPFEELSAGIDPAVSQDGRWLAFAAGRDGSGLNLWIRPLSGGGEARRLTTGLQDDHEPAFSPDGGLLAYRSEVRGGGVYLISVSGGKTRLVAPAGRRPRFAPRGRRIAYWSDTDSRPGLFLRDVAAAQSRPVHAGFLSARDPVWSPDGKYLIFAGCKDASAESCDWWVSTADGGEPTATGAARLFRQLHMDGQPSPDLWLSTGGTIVFTARIAEKTRLWSVNLSPAPWRVEGAPRRLTTREDDERAAAAAPDGRILFASRTQNIDIWSLPLHADAATPQGPVSRVTSDPAIDQRPSLSRDGKRIAWETSRGGNFEVWVKDLVSGKERAVTSGPLREHMPALSPDGSKLVYDAHDGEKVTIFESAFEGGAPVKVREENIGQGSFQWTALGDEVLFFHRAPPGSVGLLNVTSGKRTVLLRHPKLNLSLADAHLSPDGRWIAFPVPFAPHRSRLAIARVSGTVIADEKDWTYILPDTMNSFQPQWSPGGEWLYFLADQTGRLAVWALHLTREMKPTGEPRPVLDFPGVQLTIAEMRPRDIGLSVARDKLALAVSEYSGTIRSVRP